MMDEERLFLCRPCAERGKAGLLLTIKTVELLRPAREKGSCDICARRRYGYWCAVDWAPPEAVKERMEGRE